MLAPDYVLIVAGGVGYEVVCSGAAFSRLSGVKQDEDGEVYTYLQVREDAGKEPLFKAHLRTGGRA